MHAHRGQKKLEQVLEVLESAKKKLIREIVTINEVQFACMTARGTTGAIFIARHLQEKYLGKKRKLYFMLVNLEKVFGRVPLEVVQWAMRKQGLVEWFIQVVMSLYKASKNLC